jgi:hypothetical protein
LQNIAVLVSVVSPHYLNSEGALRELSEFSKAAEKHGGSRIGNWSRIFKVLKTPVPLKRQPKELRQLLGYEFYRIDPATGRVREFNKRFGPEAQKDFWIRMDDLAQDMKILRDRILHGSDSTTAGGEDRDPD